MIPDELVSKFTIQISNLTELCQLHILYYVQILLNFSLKKVGLSQTRSDALYTWFSIKLLIFFLYYA